MAYTSVTGVPPPQRNDGAQWLLYKICWAIWGVINGDFGVLVRGTVEVESEKGATITRTGYTSGLTASQTLLAANANRIYVVIDNRTGVDLFYRYGGTATTAVGGYDVRIPAGSPPVTDDGYAGAITFICGAGAAATGVNVTEVAV